MLPCFFLPRLPGGASKLNISSGVSSVMRRQGLVTLAPAVLRAGLAAASDATSYITSCAKIGYRRSTPPTPKACRYRLNTIVQVCYTLELQDKPTLRFERNQALCCDSWCTSVITCNAYNCLVNHGLRVDTGRWEDSVHLNRKDRLCLVCRSSQQVEDEHHFLFDCPAYSSIRASHASLFQCACSVSDFFDSCEANACGGFIRNCFSLRSNILAR